MFFILTFVFSALAHFPETQTLDGVEVDYIPLSREQVESSSHVVAFARYDKSGAYIYYDTELFSKISDFTKFLIIEHERAHHIFGHTLSTKNRREQKAPIPSRLTYRKEKDADCFSGYQAAEQFPEKQYEDFFTALLEIYTAMGGDSKKAPPWLLDRVNTIFTCFEGELLPYPSVLEDDGFMQ